MLLVVGITLFWRQRHWSRHNGNVWLALSTPVFATIPNLNFVCHSVSFSVTNMGPRTLDFQLRWFECKSGLRSVLVTNHLMGLSIPLSPGAATNLTWDLTSELSLDKELRCCCQISWCGHMSTQGRIKGTLDRWIDKFVMGWSSPWGEETLVSGEAFTSNVEVVDYFRMVHGLTRTKWLEESSLARTNQPRVYSLTRLPTADERIEREARLAFGAFCTTTSNELNQAQVVAQPNPVSTVTTHQ
jgi:hypothetical protein